LAIAALGLSAGGASGQSPQDLEFPDWTTVNASVASGTLRGRPISLSGSHVGLVPGSTVDGSSAVFADPYSFCRTGVPTAGRPPAYVRRAADALLAAGATLVAGHSAHLVHGAAPSVLYDLGDFVDDYGVDTRRRNDLSLLFLVEFDRHGPWRLEAVPLKLEHCYTRLASGEDADWIRRRFVDACADLGTPAVECDERVVASVGAPRA
jgi:poly-gamma-glutamate synthesis protein (capsule biosynthesis protein)